LPPFVDQKKGERMSKNNHPPPSSSYTSTSPHLDPTKFIQTTHIMAFSEPPSISFLSVLTDRLS
jgi:hypothetical protein